MPDHNAHVLAYYRSKIRRYGPYAAMRWMRNQGFYFHETYFIFFNRLPTHL